LDSWLVNTAASPAGAVSARCRFSLEKDEDVYDRTHTIWDGEKVWSAWTEFINKENILKNIFLMY